MVELTPRSFFGLTVVGLRRSLISIGAIGHSAV
jgi:hypothetical protein